MNGEIHFPRVIRAPVPIQNILAMSIPIIFNLFPKFVNSIGELRFFLSPILEKLPHTQKSLYHIRCFDKITSIIFFSERLYLARFAIPPMRPCSMEAISGFQEVNDLFKPLSAFIAADEVSVNGCKYSHYSEAATTACYNHSIICRVIIVFMKPLSCHSACRLCSIPEISKGAAFYYVKKSGIRK